VGARGRVVSGLSLLLLACSTATETAPPVDTNEQTFGGARPLEVLRIPDSYDPRVPTPLVIVLHGYGVSGLLQSIYFGLPALAEEQGFILAAPDGTLDESDRRFWNALDFCCGNDVDDVGYLLGLLDELEAAFNIDRRRVFLVGHSNGAAMSFRLACEASDRFAAVVSLGGTFYLDSSKCRPSSPVAVRAMHGTADEVIPYEGGPVSLPTGADAEIPSALAVAEAWAGYAGCASKASGDPLDIDRDIAGNETTVTRWTGCRPNAEVELWSLEGTTHVPFNLTKDLGRLTWEFLAAHPKS
jgi:polyhydroxybutyrate depolymerase